MLLQIETGAYETRRTACDVAALLRDALGGDGATEGTWARVDERVLRLAVVEALSNARKYRAPGTPL
eukprot:1488858-Prymnesium_polylepis.1